MQKRIKACGACPFKKKNNLSTENPGGSAPTVYIGQARYPFWLPCHKSPNYDGKQSNPSLVDQCAGAAIFRANIGVSDLMPEGLLKLEKDDSCFESEKEFLNHYGDQTEYTALDYQNMSFKEMMDVNVKRY